MGVKNKIDQILGGQELDTSQTSPSGIPRLMTRAEQIAEEVKAEEKPFSGWACPICNDVEVEDESQPCSACAQAAADAFRDSVEDR
jgi:hypothetical protein